MKKVGIRQAQVHLTTLLRELPFEITRHKKVVARVIDPKKKEEK